MYRGVERIVRDLSPDQLNIDIVHDTAVFLEQLAERDPKAYSEVVWKAQHSVPDGGVSVRDETVKPPETRCFPRSVARLAILRFAPEDI